MSVDYKGFTIYLFIHLFTYLIALTCIPWSSNEIWSFNVDIKKKGCLCELTEPQAPRRCHPPWRRQVGGWVHKVALLRCHSAALSPGLERWQHHTVAFSHQISVILRSPWSTPSVLTDDVLCRDSTCLSGHCSCQDCRKSQKPFWGLTFLSCPPRKYSEFFRSCHRACRDMMLTWHHSFSEA